MKKLMIAAAIVCAAAMSQAATYQWDAQIGQVDSLYAGETAAALSGQTVYFYLVADAYDATTAQKNAILSGLRSTASTGYESYLKGLNGYIGSAQMNGTLGGTAPGLKEDWSNGANMSGYAIIIDTDTAGNNWAYFATSSDVGTGYPEGSIGQGSLSLYGSDADYTYILGMTQNLPDYYDGWAQISTAAVPEPTSGLLLLLGVAGLALRRRRA